MKSLISVILSIILYSSCLSSAQTTNNSNEIPVSNYINVQDFGAIGDGIHDDTEAIQNAFNTAQKEGFSTQNLPNQKQKYSYFGSSKVVFFPLGKYKISRSIKVGSYVRIEGDQSVLFADNNIVALSGAFWQANVNEMQFIGFNRAIDAYTKNVNQGKILVTNCTFLDNEIAIYLDAKSSLSVISNCRFNDNEIVLETNSDKTVFKENWVKSASLKGNLPAQFLNYGVLHIEHTIFVPAEPMKNTKEPAWINNYGSISISGLRQGGESGSFTLINNFVEFDNTYPIVPNSIIVRDSECYAVYGNTNSKRQPAIVRLINIPNQIILDNLRGLVSASTIEFSDSTSQNRKKMPDKSHQNNIQISINNLVGGINQTAEINYPESLKMFIK